MKKTRHITFCAMMASLGVVILFLGGFTKVLDLTAVVIASIFMFVAFEETRFGSLGVYFVTGALAFIIPLVDITVAIEYIIFGIYPIIKFFLDKLNKIIGWALKLLYMTSSFVILVLIMEFALGLPEVWYINLIFCVGGVAVYIIFDVALTRFGNLYRRKLRRQLRIDRFFMQ